MDGAHMRLDRVRPKTMTCYNKAHKLVLEGLDHATACMRAGLSVNWYFKIRREKEKSEDEQKDSSWGDECE